MLISTILIFLIIVIAIALLFMWREAHLDKVQYMELKFEQFPKSFKELKLFFISDIHRRRVSEQMISEVKGKVDFVIIGGDLTEKGVSFQQVEENIRLLKELGPLFFVWGNNDYEVDYHRLDSMLLENNVKILDNTAMFFESENGEKLALIGVDSVTNHRDRLDLALQDCQEDAFKILVSHDPKIVTKIEPQDQIALVLSGHTHGGQIRFWKFGLYDKGGVTMWDRTKLFVSNGYGTTALPFRLGAPAETHLISIKNDTGGMDE